jgi:hypothetical protein
METPSLFEKNLLYLDSAFENTVIPKEHRFLLKYFKTFQQRAFLKYYYIMGDWQNFSKHTGIWASRFFMMKLMFKFKHYMSIYDKAKMDANFETLNLLNKRKIKLPKRLR